jgi:hypothetical protein
MKARRFNSLTPSVNERWASKVLGMGLNGHNGPDLVNDRCIIECKFTLTYDGENNYHISWTVSEHQMDYDKQNGEKNAYWGLGTYRLVKPVKKITQADSQNLEKLVTERELWIVPWGWMQQFQPSRSSGSTYNSQWDNILRYPKPRFLPEVWETHKVRKGKIYLTEGVDARDFDLE